MSYGSVYIMDSINIIDVEASGLAWDSYPIEIAVLVEGVTYSWLIAPVKSWTHWDMFAEGLHGITRQQIEEHGLPVDQVAEALNQVLSQSNGLLYSDAARWDGGWVNRLYEVAGVTPHFHILSLEDLLTPKQFNRFSLTFEALASSGEYRHHRAGPDVAMIYRAYCAAQGIER